uniref:Ion transport domain-containing protein n=1 Tax=Alexandrium monilatum TaxID=311494 RepID=A0A7S4RH26_9DINO
MVTSQLHSEAASRRLPLGARHRRRGPLQLAAALAAAVGLPVASGRPLAEGRWLPPHHVEFVLGPLGETEPEPARVQAKLLQVPLAYNESRPPGAVALADVSRLAHGLPGVAPAPRTRPRRAGVHAEAALPAHGLPEVAPSSGPRQSGASKLPHHRPAKVQAEILELLEGEKAPGPAAAAPDRRRPLSGAVQTMKDDVRELEEMLRQTTSRAPWSSELAASAKWHPPWERPPEQPTAEGDRPGVAALLSSTEAAERAEAVEMSANQLLAKLSSLNKQAQLSLSREAPGGPDAGEEGSSSEGEAGPEGGAAGRGGADPGARSTQIASGQGPSPEREADSGVDATARGGASPGARNTQILSGRGSSPEREADSGVDAAARGGADPGTRNTLILSGRGARSEGRAGSRVSVMARNLTDPGVENTLYVSGEGPDDYVLQPLIKTPYIWSFGFAVLFSCIYCILPFFDAESFSFNFFVDVSIIVNTFFVIIEIFFGLTQFLSLANMCFLAIFVFEVAVRMRSEKLEWFYSGWNIFDAILVLCGIYEEWAIPFAVRFTDPVALEATSVWGYLLTAFRALRLLRLLRLLRPSGSLKVKNEENDELDVQTEVWVMLPQDQEGKDKNKGKGKGKGSAPGNRDMP